MDSNDLLKNASTKAGIGCGSAFFIFIVSAILLSTERAAGICLALLLITIPLAITGFLLKSLFAKHGRAIWAIALVLGTLLGLAFPLKDDGEAKAQKESTQVIATKQDKQNVEAPAQGEGQLAQAVPQHPGPEQDAPTLEEALAELDKLVGLTEVKAEVHKLADFAKVAQARKEQGLKVPTLSYHCVFTGNPGTGKTTVARIMGNIYRALGILKSGHLVETDRSGLVAEYVGKTAIKTNAVIDSALDGVLFIDEAYALAGGNNDYGSEAIATLLKRMEDNRDRLVVIVAGYPDDMKHFIDTNPGLQSRFNRYIHFPDYTAEELAAMFRMRAKSNQYTLSPALEEKLDKAMVQWTRHRDRQFGNGRFVRNLFENTVERQAIRLAALTNVSAEQLTLLEAEDLEQTTSMDDDKPTLEEALAQLDELIGLDAVKDEVHKLADFCKIAKEREAAGMKVATMSYHCVFTGSPGTGKTTVARIMAKIYHALGILDKGHLVETDRSGLVAEYVGQTAIKTNKLIDSALGGVLFIDEAYSLAPKDSKNDYGQEAIATLLKRMEDDRDRLVVIVAGYTEEMKQFINANSGLQSRFTRYIEFPDYTTAELADIFRMQVRKNHYALSPEFEENLNKAMAYLTKNRDKNFGNARYVRNLFEKAVETQARRLAADPEHTEDMLRILELSDIGLRLKPPAPKAEDGDGNDNANNDKDNEGADNEGEQ